MTNYRSIFFTVLCVFFLLHKVRYIKKHAPSMFTGESVVVMCCKCCQLNRPVFYSQ